MYSMSVMENEQFFKSTRIQSSAHKESSQKIITPDQYVAQQAIEQSFYDAFGLMKSDNSKGYGSINKVKGVITPEDAGISIGLNLKGVRRKYFKIDYNVLREISRKVGVVKAIQNVRKMQIKPFAQVSYNDDDIGFKIKLKDREGTPDRKDKKIIDEIEDFLLHCGYVNFEGADEREDHLVQAMEMLTQEMMTIDQIAISLRYDKKGKLLDFWVLDGATIKRVIKTGYEGEKNIRFIQEIQGKTVEKFEAKDLIFYCNNQVVDLMNRGYGNSYIEQSIDLITGWLFAMSYNKEVFNTSAMPKGFLSFAGTNLDQGELEELQRQWVSMFRGIKGMWKTPFLQHDAKWVQVAPSNRDMEWNEYTQILASWICAIYGIDPAEMGVRLNQSQNVLNENPEKKISYSQDRGLKETILFNQIWMNKIIERVPEWNRYEAVFTGLENKNQKAMVEIDERQLNSFCTLNEKRAEKDLKPLLYGDIILNPSFLQYTMQKEQAQQTQNQQQGNQISNKQIADELTSEEKTALENASEEDITQAMEKSIKFKSKKLFDRKTDYIEIEI